MLRIRLSRFGTTKRPTYRLIVSEKHKDTKGDALEYLGSYQPRHADKPLQLNLDRIKYWLGKGAQPSPTVHNLLVDQKVIEGKKVHAFRVPKTEKPVEPAAPAEKPAEAPAAAETPVEAAPEPATETPAEAPTETPAAE